MVFAASCPEGPGFRRGGAITDSCSDETRATLCGKRTTWRVRSNTRCFVHTLTNKHVFSASNEFQTSGKKAIGPSLNPSMLSSLSILHNPPYACLHSRSKNENYSTARQHRRNFRRNKKLGRSSEFLMSPVEAIQKLRRMISLSFNRIQGRASSFKH